MMPGRLCDRDCDGDGTCNLALEPVRRTEVPVRRQLLVPGVSLRRAACWGEGDFLAAPGNEEAARVMFRALHWSADSDCRGGPLPGLCSPVLALAGFRSTLLIFLCDGNSTYRTRYGLPGGTESHLGRRVMTSRHWVISFCAPMRSVVSAPAKEGRASSRYHAIESACNAWATVFVAWSCQRPPPLGRSAQSSGLVHCIPGGLHLPSDGSPNCPGAGDSSQPPRPRGRVRTGPLYRLASTG